MCRVEGNGKAVMPYSVMRGDVKRHDVMRGGTFFFLGGREATPTAEDLHGLLTPRYSFRFGLESSLTPASSFFFGFLSRT